jgi:glycosyltransferase involved in cell wall biosynthesis
MTDLFIANSEAVRRDVISQERVDPDRIIVIYNGLDLQLHRRPPDKAVRRQLDIGRGPVVVVVCNFIDYKGHEFFFDAWREIVIRHPQAVAILAGDGATRPRWEQWCQREGLVSSVRFVGARRDVPCLLAASNLFVHPSLQEGYSNAVLEAMAASLPVVVTAVGGNVEAVEHERTGLVVPARSASALVSAIDRLLTDHAFAGHLGTAARTAVEARHQIARMVSEYESVYERLSASVVTDRDSRYVRDRGSV